jgi:hypothetical protein
MEGHNLFYSKDWEKMVQVFEDSLGHFYTALDDCKTLCDGSIKYDGVQGFSQVRKVLSMSCRPQGVV